MKNIMTVEQWAKSHPASEKKQTHGLVILHNATQYGNTKQHVEYLLLKEVKKNEIEGFKKAITYFLENGIEAHIIIKEKGNYERRN